MNISAASKAAGLPVKTVRYYADIGLVEAPSRSEAGYRTYNDVAIRKLVFVRRSRAIGISIDEDGGIVEPSPRSKMIRYVLCVVVVISFALLSGYLECVYDSS